ncbi:hypothetical protein NXX12_00960 [Phocaeicola vulgatus]|uniref:hypothetical protein n=1 Tax=Phocaeicola vulgatus TaxID=821 RepID=UPI002166A730|nr:hypothetical protein [Phocaeicola vulgatus]MCS3018885.1 hypothetical protein [Phocaeicola vulgatus]MCS3140625.1 hypothetical protein [Phocaeicola vulgatus]
MKDKEAYLFKKPKGFRTIRFHLTAEAIGWLGGTTKDDNDNTIGNHTLFYDLLARMRLLPAGTVHSAGRRHYNPDSCSSRKPVLRKSGTWGGRKSATFSPRWRGWT